MERWDAYSADGRRTGDVLLRGKPIPKGLYHLVCDVLVRHMDGSFLCMKRAAEKPNFGGWYEATAGGSALLGEEPLCCAKRELLEETGIDGGSFTELKRMVCEDDRCIFYIYLCITDCDQAAIRLQPGETEGYRWMDEAEFASFVRSGQMIPTQKKRYHDYFVACGYLND
jgi:8-oxo-dGTP pyrophosphatase MutT (NUDIX family)